MGREPPLLLEESKKEGGIKTAPSSSCGAAGSSQDFGMAFPISVVFNNIFLGVGPYIPFVAVLWGMAKSWFDFFSPNVSTRERDD
jgi:hypothetical protein